MPFLPPSEWQGINSTYNVWRCPDWEMPHGRNSRKLKQKKENWLCTTYTDPIRRTPKVVIQSLEPL